MATALIAMGTWDIVFIVVGVVVALLVIAASPMTRRTGDAVEQTARTSHGVDVERQFKRPGNEGDLL
jgi:hypothetical protein